MVKKNKISSSESSSSEDETSSEEEPIIVKKKVNKSEEVPPPEIKKPRAVGRPRRVNPVDTKPVVKEEVKKRPPGRPKLDKKIVIGPILGVCSEPANPDNDVEMRYSGPAVFKKIFTLFNSNFVENIIMVFEKEEVFLFAVSHSTDCIFRIVINCRNINRYYCRERLQLQMSRANLGLIINKLDSNFYTSIVFSIPKYDSPHEVKNMVISLSNTKLNSVSDHSLNLEYIVDAGIVDDWSTDNYRLSFKFEKDDFKKIITDIDVISNKFIIEKVAGDSPLVIKYTKSCNVIEVNESYDPQTINLQSKMEKMEIIAATVKIVNIKSISNAQIGLVNLFVDNERKILLKIDLDNPIFDFRALISIEDYKNMN